MAADAAPVFSDAGIPLHIGATLTFAGGRRGRFDCGGLMGGMVGALCVLRCVLWTTCATCWLGCHPFCRL